MKNLTGLFFLLFLVGAPSLEGASSFLTLDCKTAVSRLVAERDSQIIAKWTEAEQIRATELLWPNLNPPGSVKGTVVASPSRHQPDYFYHWVRDAGLVLDPVVTFFETSSTGWKENNRRILWDFVQLSRRQQLNPAMGQLGEPKFNVDGSAYQGPWMRPQNDSPAVRANTLIRFAHALLNESSANEARVREQLYGGRIPAQTVIKSDLEYIAYHWKEPGFDLWEEVMGMHFYTLMVQRRAMLDGADLARRLGDFEGAEFYEATAREMGPVIERFWDSSKGFIQATHGHQHGPHKEGLDVAVVLAALHGQRPDGWFGVTDDRVIATAEKLRSRFLETYPINHKGIVGVLIGRYVEDSYDGVEVGREGNGWVLATAAFAEFNYRLANHYESTSTIPVTSRNIDYFKNAVAHLADRLHVGQTIHRSDPLFRAFLEGIRQQGDNYLLRIKYHSNSEGTLAEQMNRYTGMQQGARDLSWSYAGFITAIQERNRKP